MSELSNENKEQEKDKQQQPAVGPDSNFSQKVLSSFEREPLTPEEIKRNNVNGKSIRTQEMNRRKQMIFLSISMQVFYPNVCFLGRSFVYRSYYAFNTWYCQKSRLA